MTAQVSPVTKQNSTNSTFLTPEKDLSSLSDVQHQGVAALAEGRTITAAAAARHSVFADLQSDRHGSLQPGITRLFRVRGNPAMVSCCAILWRRSSRRCSALFTPPPCRPSAGSDCGVHVMDTKNHHLHSSACGAPTASMPTARVPRPSSVRPAIQARKSQRPSAARLRIGGTIVIKLASTIRDTPGRVAVCWEAT